MQRSSKFEPNFQKLYLRIHTTYPANFMETTDMVQKMQQFKLYSSLFRVNMQLHIECLQITHNKPNFVHLFIMGYNVGILSAFHLPTAHCKQSVQNAHQLQEHTVKVCCKMIRLP